MTGTSGVQPLERFLSTMQTVSREGLHLAYSWRRLYEEPIDAAWVQNLDDRPDLAEGLEAFVSRFGRMQDTIGEKLLPRWLIALAETPGSMIENLNRVRATWRADQRGSLAGGASASQSLNPRIYENPGDTRRRSVACTGILQRPVYDLQSSEGLRNHAHGRFSG